MIRNVHERRLTSPPSEIGKLLDTLAGSADAVWPTDSWPAIKLDNGLTVGSAGGHGTIRYHVESYDPGRRVVFRFTPDVGITGTHTFTNTPDGADGADGSTIRHDITASTTGPMKILWPLMIRWLHDALIEDAFDNIEAALAAQPTPKRKYSSGVRALRSLLGPSPAVSSRAVRSIGDVTATALFAVGTLHAAWGLGMRWPGTDAVSLASKVVGGTSFPSPADCFAVAGLLAAATGLVVARTRPKSRLGQLTPAPLPAIGVLTVGGVVALRGVVGWLASASGLLQSTDEFRRLNLWVYSPFCIALAAGALSVSGIGQTSGVNSALGRS